MRRDSATSSKALKRFFSLAVFIGITTSAAFALLGVQRLVARTPAAQTHFTFPETPPAKQLQAWLAAFDSGDGATIQTLVAKSMPEGTGPDFADQTIQMRDQFGGLDFQKVEESTDVRFVGIAVTRLGGERIRMTVEVDSAEPHRITSIFLQPAWLPEDQAVAGRSIGYMGSEAGGWVANTDTLSYRGNSAGWRLLNS